MGEQGGSNDSTQRAYWDDYYAHRGGPALPSQFATFAAGELDQPHRIVEFGCGNGRDALFFAGHGHEVVGVDASDRAIERCTERAKELGLIATFLTSRVDGPGLSQRIGGSGRPSMVYARFFLHAITDDEQRAFLECSHDVTRPGDLMAVEFRTTRDRTSPKMTERHFRRFIEPAGFQLEAMEHGFRTSYAVEGFGFAKYRWDDAHVARCLLTRQG